MAMKKLDEHMTLLSYCEQAQKTNRFSSPEVSAEDPYRQLIFGYFGEVGSVLAALKKAKRDTLGSNKADAASNEIGDSLWYLVNSAHVCNVHSEALGQAAITFVREYLGKSRKSSKASALTLHQIDKLPALHQSRLRNHRELILRQLAGDSGKITCCAYSDILQLTDFDRAAMFGNLLGQLALLCGSFELPLEDVAKHNLKKTFDRWPASKNTSHHELSVSGKSFEQFPETFEVEFIERGTARRPIVVQQIRGLNIGDPLTDNSRKADGYRFHDVFHLSYAAHLGWSPVIRALLKLKRKSDPETDENEDGARAIIIEEGISTWIFNHAKSRDYYSDVEPGRLDFALLKQVRSMVETFQVAECPLWQWELAILDGFKVFRKLMQHRGGKVMVDLKNHSIQYAPSATSLEEST